MGRTILTALLHLFEDRERERETHTHTHTHTEQSQARSLFLTGDVGDRDAININISKTGVGRVA